MRRKLASILLVIVIVMTSAVNVLIPQTPAEALFITFPPPATNTPTRTPTPVNIGNFVWDDLDHDGIQDAGEPGLAGVTVQLWNTAKTILLDSAVTNASGNYTVQAPFPASYRLRVVLPSILDTISPKNQGSDDTADSDFNPSGTDAGFTDIFTIASNVISTTLWDCGIIVFRTPTPTRTPTPVNIGNFVWDDLDHDGIQDAGEPGLPGVTVQLWNTAKTTLLDSAITNASGNYTVQAPFPASYRLRVVLPNAMDDFSPKDQGLDDTDDSDFNGRGIDAGFTDIFTIASNVISTTLWDCGIIVFRTPTPTRTPTPVNIGNFVWYDADGDGIQDTGESGVAGITVQLWNPERTFMYDSTITNASGFYTVQAPNPGDYRIRVLPFPGSSFSPKDQGNDDTKDSDINTNIFLTTYGYSDTISIASNVISTTLWDCGLDNVGIPPTSTPGPSATPTPHVWNYLPMLQR